jgi:hypothetical protein
LRRYSDDWFDGKKAETALSMMALYRGGLSKLLQFLGKRSDDPMTEVTTHPRQFGFSGSVHGRGLPLSKRRNPKSSQLCRILR